MSLTVYRQEYADGLGDLMLSTASIAYISQAKIFTPSPEQKLVLQASAKASQYDLFYMSAILASVGWNANDDVFEKLETINARESPIDKPFNFMHNEADIIGHMTSAAVVQEDGSQITDFANVPDKFDILVHSVLYKTWADTQRQERMNKLISEILEDKWFVSMECLFAGFDYAVILPNGEHKVVARTEESAFLTKHLRVYGGTGTYNDNKVGRLLRNFAFSGKGLVDNPANKRSVIFTNTNQFSGANASIKILTKGSIMDEVTKTQLDDLKRQLDEARAENKTFQAQAKADADKAVADKLTALNQTITDYDKVIKAGELALATKETARAELEAALQTEKEKVTVLTTEVTAMKAEAVKAARLAKLVAAGVTTEDADKLLTKFAGSTEEIFDEYVALKAAFKPFGKKDEKDDKDAKKDKGKADDTTVDVKGEKTATATDLDTAKVDETVVNPPVVEDKTAALRASAATWISNSVLKTTAKLAKTDK